MLVSGKELNFVSTSEKLDRSQIKKNPEPLGRDIRLRMYYETEQIQHFLKNQHSKFLKLNSSYLTDSTGVIS